MTKISDAIFDRPLDLASEILDVPEWGVKLKVLEPTADVRAHLAASASGGMGGDEAAAMKAMYPALLVACCVDPDDDTPVFTKEDAGRLLSREGRVVDRVAMVCLRIAGLDEDGVEVPKDDSSGTPSSGGSSSSPST